MGAHIAMGEGSMSSMTPEMEALKSRLKATWNSGDYANFAKPMEPGALEFLERIAIPPGAEMLEPRSSTVCTMARSTAPSRRSIPTGRARCAKTSSNCGANTIARRTGRHNTTVSTSR
jgi:hypothetical protein